MGPGTMFVFAAGLYVIAVICGWALPVGTIILFCYFPWFFMFCMKLKKINCCSVNSIFFRIKTKTAGICKLNEIEWRCAWLHSYRRGSIQRGNAAQRGNIQQ